MRRFEQILHGEVRYPSDIAKIRAEIPEIDHLPDGVIEMLYEAFSDTYAAGWMMVDERMVAVFRSWLLAEVDDDQS